ncbi:MAG: type II toxin-antitoxin system YafQ family toxin [Syntrophobacteraceae bacterium]|jgi:mRNA-degrading endonuclease YafQ of YafQ-DinJ toxin-antitoxin module
MKRPLLRSNAFVRSARRLIRKNPSASDDIRAALHLLAEDAFHPLLKTHKLKGKFEGSWACSPGYDLRIIFEFVQYQGSEAILLETIGTHQEVY